MDTLPTQVSAVDGRAILERHTCHHFYLAHKLFSQTLLSHLWEPSIPGLWYKFVHLAKWFLKLFWYNWLFCFLNFLLHNYKNQHDELKSGKFFLTFQMRRSKTLFLFWFGKEGFPGSPYIKLGHIIVNSLGVYLFIIGFFFRFDTSLSRRKIFFNGSNSLLISLTVHSIIPY